MADTFHEQSVARSRKVRQCHWCAEKVEVGQPYKSYRFRDCGDIGYVAVHPECYDAMHEMASMEGGWFEWSIGDFKRGSTEGR